MEPDAAPPVSFEGGGGLEGVTTAETAATAAARWRGEIPDVWEMMLKAPDGSVGVAEVVVVVGVLGGWVSVGGGLGLVGGGAATAFGGMGGIPALFPPDEERDMSSCLLPADPDKVRAEISSGVPTVPALLPPDVDEERDISSDMSERLDLFQSVERCLW